MKSMYQPHLAPLESTVDELTSADTTADESAMRKLIELNGIPIQPYNEVISKHEGFVVVERADGELFYAEGLEEYVDLGDTLLDEDLKPISELPKQQQLLLKNQTESAWLA